MSLTAVASRLKFVLLLVLLVVSPVPRDSHALTVASPPAVRISQVYGGGGDATSSYDADFIELFNSSATPVSLDSWSIQYWSNSFWAVARLTGATIAPFSYHLVGTEVGMGLAPRVPPPDTLYVVSLSTIKGQIALVSNQTRISGFGDADVVDWVGYGPGVPYEGAAPAPAHSDKTSTQRKNGGCTDTDDNGADFVAAAPVPRNSAAAAHACPDVAPTITETSPSDGAANVALDANFTVTFSEPVAVSGDWFAAQCDLRPDITPASATVSGGPVSFVIDPHDDLYGDDACALTVFAGHAQDMDAADPPDALEKDYRVEFTTAPGACGEPAYPISALQGNGSSGAVGQTRTIDAVVTGDFRGADRLGGYFVEEDAADTDDDAATSEALFVSDATPDATAGQRVRLTGKVAELDGQTALTALMRAVDCGPAALPAPVTVALPAPSLAWWEQVEGMRVLFDEPLTVVGSDALASVGQLSLVAGPRPLAYTQQHAPDTVGYAAHLDALGLRRITLDDGSEKAYPDPIAYPPPALSAANTIRIGDTIPAGLTAIVDERSGAYRLQPLAAPAFTRGNARSAAPARTGGNVRAAFLSLDDYFTPNEGVFGPRGAGDQAELDRQRDKLVSALADLDADVIAVSRRENDGCGPGSALADLIDGLNGATSPGRFAAVGCDSTRWGGGEATVGLIYRTDAVIPVSSPAGLTTGAFAQDGATPAHAAPLAQVFEESQWGERLTVVVNQWRDRADCPADGPDADQGDGQGCWNAARKAAAADVIAWLATDPTGSGDPDALILGELNAFRLEDPILALTAEGYVDLLGQFAGDTATTALWEGQGGYADHALASAMLAPQIVSAGVWSINSDEPAALDYQTDNKSAEQQSALYAADPFRASDRDPVVVNLSLVPDQSDFGGEYGAAWHTGQGAWRLGAGWAGSDDGVTRGTGSWNDGQGEVSVSVSGPAEQHACLHAWLDYSDGSAEADVVETPNGQWDDNEKVIDALPLLVGNDQSLTFALPAGVIDGDATYNMRFRLIPAPDPMLPKCGGARIAASAGLQPTGRADGGEVEDWSFESGPLAVRVAAFSARRDGGEVVVTWETVDETDAASFNVYAGATREGPWQRVNLSPIPAQAPGSSAGNLYAYRSAHPAPWWLLEGVELTGARQSWGSVLAEDGAPNAIMLRSAEARAEQSTMRDALLALAIGGLLLFAVAFGKRQKAA